MMHGPFVYDFKFQVSNGENSSSTSIWNLETPQYSGVTYGESYLVGEVKDAEVSYYRGTVETWFSVN